MSAPQPTQQQKEACWQYIDDFTTCNRAWLQTRNYFVSGGDLLDCSRHYKLMTACLSDQSPFYKDKGQPSALEQAKLEHPVWQLRTAEEARKAWEAVLYWLVSWTRLQQPTKQSAKARPEPINKAQTSALYRVERLTWTNSRSQKLCVYSYRCHDPSAVVFFHHGICEYCGWWKRLFTVLAEANMDVLAYDMHGHGLSEPKNPDGRVCIRSAQHLLDDAEGFLEEVVLPAVHRKSSTPHQEVSSGDEGRDSEGSRAPLPLYGVAHSLGGGVLTLLESKRPGTFAALALNAPALGRRITLADYVAMVVVALLRVLCPLAQLIPSTPWHQITDDHAIPHRAQTDAHYFNEPTRVITAHSIVQRSFWDTAPQSRTITIFLALSKVISTVVAITAHCIVQFFLMLNAAAKVNLVTCPMYVQWAGNEVLTCRSAAELWRDTRNSAAKSIMRKHTRRWGLGDIPRAVWIVVFGRKGAEEGSRSSNYGTQVSNQASPSPRPKGPGGGVRRQLRKLREFKWEEVKDGAMHVMIHGRRGPALVACIRDWLLQQIDASSSSVATGVHAHWDQDSALSDMHEDHATEPAYEELLGSQEIPSDCDLTPNVKSRGARDVAFEHTQDYDECSDTAHGRSTAVESSTRNVKKRRTTAVDIQAEARMQEPLDTLATMISPTTAHCSRSSGPLSNSTTDSPKSHPCASPPSPPSSHSGTSSPTAAPPTSPPIAAAPETSTQAPDRVPSYSIGRFDSLGSAGSTQSLADGQQPGAVPEGTVLRSQLTGNPPMQSAEDSPSLQSLEAPSRSSSMRLRSCSLPSSGAGCFTEPSGRSQNVPGSRSFPDARKEPWGWDGMWQMLWNADSAPHACAGEPENSEGTECDMHASHECAARALESALSEDLDDSRRCRKILKTARAVHVLQSQDRTSM